LIRHGRIKYERQNKEEHCMEQTLEHHIRERAYTLWLATGCADGNAEQHWLAAEREVLACLTGTLVPQGPAAPKARKTRMTGRSTKPRARAAGSSK